MHKLYAEATMVYVIFMYDFYEQKIFILCGTAAKLFEVILLPLLFAT